MSQELHWAARAGSTGAGLLDDVRRFISRFCVFPDKRCLDAVSLWAAHTHLIEHLHTTPRLALLSPEAGSGKTRVLEILNLLSANSMFSLNASPAAIFRSLNLGQITLLFDEVDAIWTGRGSDDRHEDLRALLNAGYKRGAMIPRCVGPSHEVTRFPVYAPVALAGLGSLPETIMSRSVIIGMRRRAPTEFVEPFRSRSHEPEGFEIRDRLADWADAVGATTGESIPSMPTGIVDRPAEVWEPLIALADAAGGHWPRTARKACRHLCHTAASRHQSLGIRLLSDLKIAFGDAKVLHTREILNRLCGGGELEADAPWRDLRGKQLNAYDLARHLRSYGVTSTKLRIEGQVLQGRCCRRSLAKDREKSV